MSCEVTTVAVTHRIANKACTGLSQYNDGKAEVKKGVRLEQKLEPGPRVEAGQRQVGVSNVLGLSGPTSKYI